MPSVFVLEDETGAAGAFAEPDERKIYGEASLKTLYAAKAGI